MKLCTNVQNNTLNIFRFSAIVNFNSIATEINCNTSHYSPAKYVAFIYIFQYFLAKQVDYTSAAVIIMNHRPLSSSANELEFRENALVIDSL